MHFEIHVDFPFRFADGKYLEDVVLEAIKALTTKELELAKARLSLIASRAKDYLDEVAESWAQMIAWQDDLLMKQYKGECSSVSALAAIIKDAAANEQELPYDIVLEGVELVIDESKMVIEGPAPPVRATPVEAEAPRGIFKVKHLEALARAWSPLKVLIRALEAPIGTLLARHHRALKKMKDLLDQTPMEDRE